MSKNEEIVNTQAPEMLLSLENDIISNILDAARDDADEIATIEIIRKGKPCFSFRIRPLSEGEYNACRRKHTRYKQSKTYGGMRLPEETNTTAYRSELILTATIDEDRKAIWGDPKLLNGLGVVSQVEAIDKVLRAGEKDRIVDKINEISGFSDDDEDDSATAEETLKN